ncbi:hypothetical protein LCGC14_2242560 [marine sediment metagenome]|uniref:Cytidyltransferase-like domain-containing protein n=1 Tax=marine sediment metagenome TaxID=412755 RepID=A0A0F9FZY7_9ZZZZ
MLGDHDLSIIERLRTFQRGRLILKDVLFEMSGWILIYRISPSFCIDILRTFLIREDKGPQILPRPFDLYEFNFSFERQDFSSEDVVEMLNLDEEWGLRFIHLINNEAIQLWKKLEGPLHHGPLLTQITDYYDRTPICQTLNLEDKEVEVWGDERVYKWIFHLGPDIIKATLEALEKGMLSKIENDRQDPKQLVKMILSETTSFAVVATCLKVILSLIFEENGESTMDKDRIGLLLESILPILRKPAFWYLHSQLFAEARVYRRSNISTVINVIDLLVFAIPTASISEEIISNIRHFKEAKKKGDKLVVSITSDKFVNKGPGRPAFNEKLRLESIAALSSVDYVVMNNAKDAINAIRTIKPDYYVKGKEYNDAKKDITGKIIEEAKEVKTNGGQIYFTDDIVFSSSSLINKYVEPISEKAKNFIQKLKTKYSIEQIVEKIEELSSLKVLIIGDAIIDEYQYVDLLGQSAKGQHLVANCRDSERFLGGSLIIANHISEFCDNVTLFTNLGKNCKHLDFINKNLNDNVKVFSLPSIITFILYSLNNVKIVVL